MTKTKAQTKARTTSIQTQIRTSGSRKPALTLGELALRSFALLDGEEMHRSTPETYLIPPAQVRATLQAGQTVMLVFRQGWFSPVAEKMWVKITRREEDGYVGRLVNEPVHITALRFGDEVRFLAKNVVKILTLDHAQRNAGAACNIRSVEAGVNNL